MKLSCVECHTEFQLDPDRINESGSMVRCLKCSYIFTVYPPNIYGSAVTQDTIKFEVPELPSPATKPSK